MGIFDDVNLFTPYRATIHVPGRLYGGIPGDPKLLESWIQAKVGADDEVIRQLWIRNLQEQGAEVNDRMSVEELRAAAEGITAEKKTNVFKRAADGELYIEGRQIKACLKEATNILYVGQRFGKREKGDPNGVYSGKSAIAYFAERIFVLEDQVGLGRRQVDGVDLQIIHAPGRESALSYVEYVEDVRLTFHVEVLKDCLSRQTWGEIWTVAQREGLGARRSQSFGRFEIVEWEKLPVGSVQRGRDASALMAAVR